MARVTAASTLAFSLSPLETALERIAVYGFHKVELSDQITHCKHFAVDTVDPVVVQERLGVHGLTPVSLNACIIAVPDRGQWPQGRLPVEAQSAAETEEIRAAKRQLVFFRLHEQEQATAYVERALLLLDKAQAAGIPQVCLQGGRRKQAERIDEELEAAAGVIDMLAEAAAARGIRALLEMPHLWDLYYDLDKSKQMLSHLRSDNVGVVVDSTHWHTSGYDINDYVKFLGQRLWHVHLRDAAGKDTAAGDYQLEKTPGRGEVDFSALGEALDKHGYRGEVTLETEYKNYSSPDEVDEENLFALHHLRSVGWEIEANQPETG